MSLNTLLLWSYTTDNWKPGGAVLLIQIESSTKMYTPFLIGINDMDQLRISGTEPSSVIISQVCSITS